MPEPKLPNSWYTQVWQVPKESLMVTSMHSQSLRRKSGRGEANPTPSDKPFQVCPKQFNMTVIKQMKHSFWFSVTKDTYFVYFSTSSKYFLDWINHITNFKGDLSYW